jgi:hypothetical protein
MEVVMLDDLRDDAVFLEEEDQFEEKDEKTSAGAQTNFLGMTPEQRFVIAVMILLMVCIMGSFFLLITGSVNFSV